MNVTQIGHKVELDNFRLEGRLRFLYDRGLVGEQKLGEEKKGYFVTERGLSMLKVMGPLVNEAQRIQVRNFEVVSSVLSEAEITPKEVIKKIKKENF